MNKIIISCSFFLCFLFLNANQSEKKTYQVTIHFKDQLLDSALYQLDKSVRLSFCYADSIINGPKKINKSFEDTSIEQILDELLIHTNYKYIFFESNICIYKKNDEFLKTFQKDSTNNIITGKVIFEDNGKGIDGAIVFIIGHGWHSCCQTNNEGIFTAQTTDMDVVLQIKYLGCQTRTVNLQDAALIKLVDELPVVNEIIHYGPARYIGE